MRVVDYWSVTFQSCEVIDGHHLPLDVALPSFAAQAASRPEMRDTKNIPNHLADHACSVQTHGTARPVCAPLQAEETNLEMHTDVVMPLAAY